METPSTKTLSVILHLIVFEDFSFCGACCVERHVKSHSTDYLRHSFFLFSIILFLIFLPQNKWYVIWHINPNRLCCKQTFAKLATAIPIWMSIQNIYVIVQLLQGKSRENSIVILSQLVFSPCHVGWSLARPSNPWSQWSWVNSKYMLCNHLWHGC